VSPESAPGPWSGITRTPIDPSEVLARVGSDEDGAVILFLGTVRNHADGRPVGALRYEAYDEMAAEVLERLVREAAEKLGTNRVAVVHRVGELDVGEVSVAIAVSSPHRDEAYRISRWIIEEIKVRLPIWKKEGYLDGDEEWVEGAPIREG
jgi:molybdopterin synthase catalytic subunit